MFSFSRAVIIFFTIFPLISATGHLRLELTSSKNFILQLKTNTSFQEIQLAMGNPRTLSFHPKDHQETLEISFSNNVSDLTTVEYHMNSNELNTYQTILFSDAVLLVQSVFKCDTGFVGDKCQDIITSTSTTVISTTTTEIKTSTTKVIIVINDVPKEASALQQ